MISPPAIIMHDAPDIERAKELTKSHEGLRLQPYRCPAGHLTIGWGHNLDAKPITRQAAEVIFAADYAEAQSHAAKALGPAWDTLDPVRRAALTDMAFQMGLGYPRKGHVPGKGLRSFTSMLSAMRLGDWSTAKLECLDSPYARTQTPSRARRIARMIETGLWP